uniref:Uncharacterized protein n=1 Tax=Clytia hemisphaerica TaxID=252671 RepID=A0A7M5XDP8_9CNID
MKDVIVLNKFLKKFGVTSKNTIFNFRQNLNNDSNCNHQILSNFQLHQSIIQGHLDRTILYLEGQNESINIDQLDIHGYTPLIYAIKYEHIDIVNYLLFKGAFVNLESTADGLSPWEYAVSTGNQSILKALETWGAKC